MNSKKPRSSSSGDVIVEPVKRMSIVLSSQPTVVTQTYFSDVWENRLRPVVQLILRGENTAVTNKREVLYREVDKIVKIKFSELLLQALEYELTVFCRRQLVETTMTVAECVSAFESYVESLSLISKIFNSLDRELIYQASIRSSDRPKNIMSLGFSVWRKYFCNESGDSMTDKSVELIDAALAMIREARITGSTHNNMTMQVFALLTSINIFHSRFEQLFMTSTREFYIDQADAFLGSPTSTLAAYLDLLASSFEFERSFLSAAAAPSSTWRSVDSDILRQELVLNRLPSLIQRDLIHLVRASDAAQIKSLFDVSNLVSEKLITESVLRFSFGDCVTALCREVVAGGNLDVINNLMSLKNQLISILQTCFANKSSFFTTYKDCMQSVVNDPTIPIPSLLAEWIDRRVFERIDSELAAPMLSSSTSDSEWVPDIVALFKLLDAKDIFEVNHRQFLSKRLVYIASHNSALSGLLDLESALINDFRNECGAGYTNKLESMVRDILSSEEYGASDACRSVSALARQSDFGFKVSVLTTGVWPTSAWPEMVHVPKPVENVQSEYVRKYSEAFSKKSIKYVYSLSSAVVRFNRRTELICSAVQGIILLSIFNETDSVDANAVSAETGIPSVEVSRALTAMVEYNLLNIGDGIYSVNPAFAKVHSSTAVVLNNYQFRKPILATGSQLTDAERAQTESSVLEDRQHQLDAAIIRTMKKTKKCTLAYLVAEIGEVFKFSFAKHEINKRIESLIDREFLEKCDGDEIKYLA